MEDVIHTLMEIIAREMDDRYGFKSIAIDGGTGLLFMLPDRQSCVVKFAKLKSLSVECIGEPDIKESFEDKQEVDHLMKVIEDALLKDETEEVEKEEAPEEAPEKPEKKTKKNSKKKDVKPDATS